MSIITMVTVPEAPELIRFSAKLVTDFLLNSLVRDGELIAKTHKGYWQCMDTLREKQQLEKLWESGNAPWKIWEE